MAEPRGRRRWEKLPLPLLACSCLGRQPPEEGEVDHGVIWSAPQAQPQGQHDLEPCPKSLLCCSTLERKKVPFGAANSEVQRLLKGTLSFTVNEMRSPALRGFRQPHEEHGKGVDDAHHMSGKRINAAWACSGLEGGGDRLWAKGWLGLSG